MNLLPIQGSSDIQPINIISKDYELWEAAKSGKWNKVRAILKEYIPSKDITYGSEQITLLLLAAESEELDVVDLLVRENARHNKNSPLNIDAAREKGGNAGKSVLWFVANMFEVSNEKKCNLIELMLKRKPDANIESGIDTYEGETVLWVTQLYATEDIVKLMLELNPHANTDAGPKRGENKNKTVLWFAVNRKHWDNVKLMQKLRPHGNIDTNPKWERIGETPLLMTAYNKKWDIVNMMIKNKQGSDFNTYAMESDDDGDDSMRFKSVFWLAVEDKAWETVDLMLKNNSKIDLILPKLEDLNLRLKDIDLTPEQLDPDLPDLINNIKLEPAYMMLAKNNKWDIILHLLINNMGVNKKIFNDLTFVNYCLTQVDNNDISFLHIMVIYYLLFRNPKDIVTDKDITESSFNKSLTAKFYDQKIRRWDEAMKFLAQVFLVSNEDQPIDTSKISMKEMPTEVRYEFCQKYLLQEFPEFKYIPFPILASFLDKLETSLPEYKFLKARDAVITLGFKNYRWTRGDYKWKKRQINDVKEMLKATLNENPRVWKKGEREKLIELIGNSSLKQAEIRNAIAIASSLNTGENPPLEETHGKKRKRLSSHQGRVNRKESKDDKKESTVESDRKKLRREVISEYNHAMKKRKQETPDISKTKATFAAITL